MQDAVGGFQVDFGSVLAWLGLIRARCAAGLAVAFGLLQGCGSASLGPGLVVGRCPKPPILAQNLQNHIPEAAHCARVAVSERDEMYLIGQRAVQERDAKMNEEIKIARDRAHQGNALHDRATLRDQEFVDVTREFAASRQKTTENPITSIRSLQCPERSKRHDKSSRSKRALCTSWQRRTRNSRARMPHKLPSRRMQKIVDELYSRMTLLGPVNATIRRPVRVIPPMGLNNKVR